MHAYSPKGSPILGTYDLCPCRAEISAGTFRRAADGSLTFDHEGSTELFYDGQETVTRDGQAIYLDEDGEEWPENQIVLCDGEFIAPDAIPGAPQGDS